ncbi:9395_t:CDS:1, partial [Paraglomus occultum]
MSQQPFWTDEIWNQQKESGQQQPTQQEYIDYDGSNKYLYQSVLQAGQPPQQYLPPQLPADALTFGGLPTQPLSYIIMDTNLAAHERLGTGSIQQHDNTRSTRQTLPTHRQKRQQRQLSQYPYSRQPMQS